MPGVSMGQDGHVGQHLMVDEFVLLGGLNDPVQYQDAPESGVVEDGQMLMRCAVFKQHRVHAEQLTIAVIEGLNELAHAPSSP